MICIQICLATDTWMSLNAYRLHRTNHMMKLPNCGLQENRILGKTVYEYVLKMESGFWKQKQRAFTVIAFFVLCLETDIDSHDDSARPADGDIRDILFHFVNLDFLLGLICFLIIYYMGLHQRYTIAEILISSILLFMDGSFPYSSYFSKHLLSNNQFFYFVRRAPK